jgi:hypothetical protein
METTLVRGTILTILIPAFLAVPPGAAAATPSPPAAAPESSEVRFTVNEKALLDVLRAATPQTIAVGTSLLTTELTLLDPRDLVLGGGRATFKIRVKGRDIPIDQVVSPVVTVERDPRTGQHFGVVSSMPLALPGGARIDLRDFLPRIEIPAVVDNPWNVADRPLGLRLRIRRIAILEHLLEVGADVDIAPVVSSRTPGSE